LFVFGAGFFAGQFLPVDHRDRVTGFQVPNDTDIADALGRHVGAELVTLELQGDDAVLFRALDFLLNDKIRARRNNAYGEDDEGNDLFHRDAMFLRNTVKEK